MNAPDHSIRAHALLSASSADRWIACTPSARLNDAIKDEGSVFAAEGTRAHELAERTLLSGRQAHEIDGDWPIDMRDYVQQYVDYVRAVPGERMIEQRLAFTKWVQEGFGTCDAIVIADGHLTIVDLKYGKGLRVDAPDNAQLMLYALAALDAYDAIYGPIHTVKMVIHQPRLDHVDEHEMSADALYAWADNTVKPAAEAAWKGEGEFKTGDHCQFCKVRHTCRARAEVALATAKDEMGNWCPPAAHLSNEELAELYPRLDGLVRWANDLSDYALTRAEAGIKFPGLKLVAGRSVRVIADPEKAVEALRSEGYCEQEYLNSKIRGITDLEKLLGKTKFVEVLGPFVQKPEGRPTLVVASDKRPELDLGGKAMAVEEMKCPI